MRTTTLFHAAPASPPARGASRRWRALVGAASLLTAACATIRAPAPTVDPDGRPISSIEIQNEMRPTYESIYGLLLGLGGGAVGMVLGAKVGYEIDQLTPCVCEDPGLAGALLGALVGSLTGLTVGSWYGSNMGYRQDRLVAIERIIERRSAPDSAAPRPGPGAGLSYGVPLAAPGVRGGR